VDGDGPERQLNLQVDPESMAGVYANFVNVSFSDYEFTLTFARVEHEAEEGDLNGIIVCRVNASPRLVEDLLGAVQEAWSRWSTREGIRNLPENRGPSSGD
jgi:Protein of unknown function (DUF3467)